MTFRRGLFRFVVGVLAAGYGTQAFAGALQNVFISRSEDVAVIEIRFNCFHRFASQTPQGQSATFQLTLVRMEQCGPVTAEGGRDSTRPAGREIVALDEVDYVARERGEATLELRFIRPVQIFIRQTGDLGGLQVRLRAPTGAPEEALVPAVPAAQAAAPSARTPERIARADAAAAERAARLKAPATASTANYAINLSTTATQVVTADLTGVAASGERLYAMKSELDTGTVFRLRLGFFTTEASAETALARLKGRYPDAWIVKIGAADHDMAETLSPATVAEQAPLAAAPAAATGAARTPEMLAALMADARAAVLAGDFSKSARLCTEVLAEPPNQFSAEAREVLGVSRERTGQFPQAIAEYRRYLEQYPEGEGADRVRQRLVALTTARDAPKTGLRAASRGEAGSWDAFGSFSQYYRRDSAYTANGQTATASMFLTDGDVSVRKRGDRFDFASRATLGYDFDLLSGPSALGNRTRIYNLYADLYDRDLGLGARLGRQTDRSAGILGRYDGIHVSYLVRPDIKLNVVGGFPVYLSSDGLDTNRVFYGTSVDFNHLLNRFDTSIFFNMQQIGGVTDRQAVGAEVRYFDGTRSVIGLVDYDFNFGTLNSFNVIGNWAFESGLAVSASADYRRSPFPLTENALIGQTAGTIDELLRSLTEEQIRQLAVDRSGKMLTYSLGLSQPLAQRWQVNADFSFVQLAEGPGSGGVLALPDSGREYYFYTSLVGSSLFTEGDVSIFGFRFSDSYNTRTTAFYVDSRYPLTNRLRVNPRLTLSLRQIDAGNASEWVARPSLRLLYRFARHYQVELEGGGDVGTRNGTTYVNGNNAAYYFYMGYRAEF